MKASSPFLFSKFHRSIFTGDSSSLKSGERLLDAITLVDQELGEMHEHAVMVKQKGLVGRSAERVNNRLLLGLHPLKYLLKVLRDIKVPLISIVCNASHEFTFKF